MFDKEAFAEALGKLQGDRSLNSYARDCGVSSAYISKFKNELVNKAPSPAILLKLADRHVDNATYRDLMAITGHIIPLEESSKIGAQIAHLLKFIPKIGPITDSVNNDSSKHFPELSQEEAEELDLFAEQSTTEEILDFITKLNNIGDVLSLIQGVDELNALTDSTNLIPVSQRTVRVPILGEIACGEPILAEENILDYRTVLKENLPSGDLVYLLAKGDSMKPTVPNGSWVLIRLQEEVENGEIAAVTFNGNTEVTLKRVKKQGNNIILMPDNNDFEPTLITEDNPVRIVGKAVRSEQEL